MLLPTAPPRAEAVVSDLELRLRQLVHLSDPDGTVTIRWLAGLLGEPLPDVQVSTPTLTADMDLHEVALHFKRSVSTIRGWLSRGELRGYKLNGRDWRVPPAAVGEYEERQQQRPRTADPVDIREWRSL